MSWMEKSFTILYIPLPSSWIGRELLPRLRPEAGLPMLFGGTPKGCCVGMSVKESLKFSDTIRVIGYDSKGDKKRGRPRGTKTIIDPDLPPQVVKFVPVVIEGNRQLYEVYGSIRRIIISGYRVIVLLSDSTKLVIR